MILDIKENIDVARNALQEKEQETCETERQVKEKMESTLEFKNGFEPIEKQT
jgi:hypothetical protein